MPESQLKQEKVLCFLYGAMQDLLIVTATLSCPLTNSDTRCLLSKLVNVLLNCVSFSVKKQCVAYSTALEFIRCQALQQFT
jgi:hypothetical protein